jgi:hypothetical protein
MDPIVNLKRAQSVDFNVCIFCQRSDEGLRSASSQGLETLKKASESRKKVRDTKSRIIIDRLDDVVSSNSTSLLLWHKNCYSQFTDKNKIHRLELQFDSNQTETDPAPGSKTNQATHRPLLRSALKPIDSNMCMFCQDVNNKERLSSVMTKKTSNDILQAAKLDCNLSCQLASVSDLIAAEAKYHLTCFSAFKRTTLKTQHCYQEHPDLPMIWLASELHYAAEKGHVLRLSDVWDRYVKLSDDSNTVIPKSFISRRGTFKEKLQLQVSNFITFVQPVGGPAERETLLFPSKFVGVAISQLSEENDEKLTMPRYEPQDDIFLSLVHVALKLRGDLTARPGHIGFGVTEQNAFNCIPESVYMFLQLLYGGPSLLERDTEDEIDEDEKLKQKVLSTGQDMVYGVSCGRKLTPKHIGLASTLHQVTRSKELVQLFHNAGHILSYHETMQLDTALAETTLKSMDLNTGAVIPPNLVPNTFVYYTADNIDILDDTLDGKETFHATQVAAWQRGPEKDLMLDTMKLSTKRTLHVPEVMGNISASNMPTVRPNPAFLGPVDKTWYDQSTSSIESVVKAEATDIAFNMMREKSTIDTSWTVFNEALSTTDPAITTVGYMPIIQAPAHEYDTLQTVVERCMQVSGHFDQEYTVISVDQALYGKLMELKWSNPDYRTKLIPRLGGLHISMNFLKVIGQHMQGSGLADAWVEAGIMGPNIVEAVMSGKKYNKAMRAHKLTVQALWHLLGPSLLSHVEKNDQQLFDNISTASSSNDIETLVGLLSDPQFITIMSAFVDHMAQEDINFSFWWGYMKMVSILLMFTRAQRDGIWDLHLYSFTSMLPFFLRYDHYNYGRWGPVYIADMHNLPAVVLEEFKQGNFVVKRSKRKFNQVDPDQAQEWLNGTGKRGGGIVGITKTSSALNRWALSYNLRSHIAADTREMFSIYPKDVLSHNEAKPSRQNRDNSDENTLLSILRRFQLFAPTSHPTILQNIATKDLATDKIQRSLLDAKALGLQQLDEFVNDRLLVQPHTTANISLYDTIKKNKAPTFENLYDIIQPSSKINKTIVMKADKNVLQRLVTAYAAGRDVDLDTILKHELLPVPVSLAEMNGSLRTGSKSLLADILTSNIECPATIDLEGRSSCLLIDGQARVVAIGKPPDAKTFGDLADIFTQSIFQSGTSYDRIDVIFDRYREESIKSETRLRRTKTARPIRRVIEGRDVPLPSSWLNFISLPNNKADLARFLSDELLTNAPTDKEIVVAGGFLDEQEVKSSRSSTNLSSLRATHEEADTRLLLHVINNDANTVVVSARDTDVLLILVSHFARVNCENLWMMAGTAKKRKYIPIGPVFHNLPPNSVDSLLPFHGITGCDTTSYMCGHTKKSAWKIFQQHHQLLSGLGVGTLNSDQINSAESFVCKMYGVANIDSVDFVRKVKFEKCCKPELLPPTSNSLMFHIRRVHYQCFIWKNAHCPVPELPDVTELGWKRDSTGLQPILMTLSPIPQACLELVSCSCKTKCRTMRCKCRKSNLVCTAACGCRTPHERDGCFNSNI